MDRRSFDSSWEKIHAKRIWGGYPTEHVIRFVARNYYNAEDRGEIKILDFGCGAGSHTWCLLREGFDTYAFDGSPSAVQNTINKLNAEAITYNVDHICCVDGLKQMYKDNYFHGIIDNVSIQANLYEDICQMYKNCYRMLLPEGKLFTSVFGKDTTGYGTGQEIESGTYENLREGRLQHSGKRHFFEKDELNKILLDCGFREICIDNLHYTDGEDVIHQWIATAEK